MPPIYTRNFQISDVHVDCFGRLTPAKLLYFIQEASAAHFSEISMDYDALASLGMFWAVTRHKVQISRLPLRGETITIETWPMPTTKVAYPRSVIGYDAEGHELFRSISLWVLMDAQNRSMVLPGKSGIEVLGSLRGNELASPLGLPAKALQNQTCRTVAFTDLDRNGHMNNTRYFDWIADLLPASFHAGHTLKEFTACYQNEAREGYALDVSWGTLPDGALQIETRRKDGNSRIFTAKLLYD